MSTDFDYTNGKCKVMCPTFYSGEKDCGQMHKYKSDHKWTLPFSFVIRLSRAELTEDENEEK